MRGLFVTGTDTGVGKSVLAAAVCAALAARGERVAAFKPVVTGLAREGRAPAGARAEEALTTSALAAAPTRWPPDHELLAGAASAGQRPDEVAPYRFGPAVSPHLAAEMAGEPIDRERLVAAARAAAQRADALVCEGVGGLLVPLAPRLSVRDLARELGFPLVVAARAGLGTINHTLLAVEAARAAGLRVAAVVMTPWPRRPGALERSNRATVERLGAVRVSGLRPASPERLGEVGGDLPIDDWL